VRGLLARCWAVACVLGRGLRKPKAQLPEQTLALPYPKVNLILSGDPGRQCFTIPKIPAQPHISRHLAKDSVDVPEVLLIEASGATGPLTFTQPGQAPFLKTPHPILDGPRSIPQQHRDLRARHAVRHQQDTMESMVIAGFL